MTAPIEADTQGEILKPLDELTNDLKEKLKLGLVAPGPAGLGMANPIYREVVPRALTAVTEPLRT